MALDGTEEERAESNEPSSETVLVSEASNVEDVDPPEQSQPEDALELATSQCNANCEAVRALESGSSQAALTAQSDEATADPTKSEELATSEWDADYQEPEEEQCNYVSKKKAKSIRARLKEMTFEDYWEVAGSYLFHICQANDSVSGMPIRGVAQMLPPRESLTDDEYEVAYASKVKELAEKDFYKQQAHDTTARCRLFLHKITRFGYVHGFEHMSSAEASSAKKRPSEDSTNLAEKASERKLPCYDGMELFTDVEYQAYESVYYGNQVLPKYDGKKGSRKASKDASDEPTIHETPAADMKDFDFSFKPERDAALIAKNADKVLSGDKEIMKYWFQRYRLFSKLNDGVLMDREGWFSVTPEHIGAHIADRMVTRPGCVILDAFTGVGGNAIQFALKGAYVVAVDLDPVRLRCALQNARVYGVADYITFICGNFFHVAKSLFGARQAGSDGDDDSYYGIDAVFLSPPWGGPSYLQEKVYDLDKQEPNGYEIFRIARKISPNIGYFLPRNTSVKQLIALAGPGGRVEVEHDVLNGKTKTLTAYFGDLVAS
ncbi:Protein T08G11.4 b [Aphelenchoides avenae]|nr:Protein T08G11.4 b [Aphelenchus avenae]